MKGFLRRDLCLLGLNARFYLVCLLAMGLLCFFSDFDEGFLSLYIVIFCITALMSLFNYDEFNQWLGYAAAIPGGRRAQVDARYATALLLNVAATVLMLGFSRLSRLEISGDGWAVALLYGAFVLLYVDIVFPLTYRFGAKSRLMMILVLAVIAGGVGAGGVAFVRSGGQEFGGATLPLAVGALWAAALAGSGASWLISRRIMEKKEF